ncbi:AT-hook motif nuclear-localized protein 9-like isoform X2 [Carya illinoinensis]|uniref:AT-hook motif nuclear-localized protein n=1 Tax=Carya illinoinensis TaxID=32201 RepID=A0A8T1NRA3_CARIL|nr:AT-hook motif nuclear-localized protein 9-like isoform X2 [Carya illinoinensis]XP_042956972.1 AT-hook motif nuclear-localized protein 9-like isoform X2 [Carya illinoinensis]KAG6632191.1 hypothetical protein CIPAW_13G141600 [Carya illinoinensis]
MNDMNNSSVVEQKQVAVAVEEAEMGGEESGPVVVGSEKGLSSPIDLGEVGKRRRGRPRKYEVDGKKVGPVSESPSKRSRGRGRPRGSGKLQALASLGAFAADTAGGNFTPHVVPIQTGEDIVSKISSLSQKGPRAVCILSATGLVSSVIIRKPGSSGGISRYEGRFEILSLSGSYTFGEMGGVHRKNGMLSVSLAEPDGRVFGGGIAGALIAAGPTQLIIASFKQNINKEIRRKHSHTAQKKRKHSVESNAAASIPRVSDTGRVPKHIAKISDGDDSCTTPTSALLESVYGRALDILAGKQNMTPASSLHSAGQNASDPLQQMQTK